MSAASDLQADFFVDTEHRIRPELRVLRGGREATVAPSSSSGYFISASTELSETAYLHLRRAEWRSTTRSLEEAIAAARGLLALGDNWDGEGSPGYAEATLERARHFLVHGADRLWEVYRGAIRPPHVGAGPDGSIDLHWRDTERHLLVNVPADPAAIISFYGHDPVSEVKGEFEGDANAEWLFRWLAG